jgi:hypothetical protein
VLPIENSPPGIHTIPFGPGPRGFDLFSIVGLNAPPSSPLTMVDESKRIRIDALNLLRLKGMNLKLSVRKNH